MKLPEPLWLTLNETLHYLTNIGVSETLAKERLHRAFRHAEIRTQGRSLLLFRTDIMVEIPEFAWLSGAVKWDATVIALRNGLGDVFDIDYVEVCHDELIQWVNKIVRSGPEYRSPFVALMLAAEAHFGMRLLPSTDHAVIKEIEDWLKEHWEEFVKSPISNSRLTAMAGLIRHPDLGKGGIRRSK
jgi:hypothetical protein